MLDVAQMSVDVAKVIGEAVKTADAHVRSERHPSQTCYVCDAEIINWVSVVHRKDGIPLCGRCTDDLIVAKRNDDA